MACRLCGEMTPEDREKKQLEIVILWLETLEKRRHSHASKGVGRQKPLNIPELGDYVKGNGMEGIVLKISEGEKNRQGARPTLIWIDIGKSIIAVSVSDVKSHPRPPETPE